MEVEDGVLLLQHPQSRQRLGDGRQLVLSPTEPHAQAGKASTDCSLRLLLIVGEGRLASRRQLPWTTTGTRQSVP